MRAHVRSRRPASWGGERGQVYDGFVHGENTSPAVRILPSTLSYTRLLIYVGSDLYGWKHTHLSAAIITILEEKSTRGGERLARKISRLVRVYAPGF